MAANNRILTTTQDKLLPKVVDTVLDSNVLFTRIVGAAKKWSGEQMKKSVKVSKNTTGQSFSGTDLLSTDATDNRVRLAFDPRFYTIAVQIPLTDLSINARNETKVIDLMSAEMETSAQDMADDLGELAYLDGTGEDGKDIQGLGAIVDDGTDVATYGGQSRSTYSTLGATVTASGGTLTLAKMATLHSAITSGSQKPTLGVCDQTVWDLIEQLFTPQERIIKDVNSIKNGLKGGGGYVGLYYRGVPIVADEQATAETLFFLNEKHLDFYALPVAMTEEVKYKTVTEGNDYGQPLGLGFSFSGWIKPANQAVLIGHIYLGGEFISWNPKRQGKLTGITGV